MARHNEVWFDIDPVLFKQNMRTFGYTLAELAKKTGYERTYLCRTINKGRLSERLYVMLYPLTLKHHTKRPEIRNYVEELHKLIRERILALEVDNR